MQIAIYYLSIGAAFGILAQFTMSSPEDGLLRRLWTFILTALIWPLILLVGARDLFGMKQKFPPLSERDKLPPLHGGDGLTAETPVIVNCASMSMANMLIDRFISERHGEVGTQWRRGMEMSITNRSNPSATIRGIVVELSDDSNVTYYFDTSRPFAATLNLMRMADSIPGAK